MFSIHENQFFKVMNPNKQQAGSYVLCSTFTLKSIHPQNVKYMETEKIDNKIQMQTSIIEQICRRGNDILQIIGLQWQEVAENEKQKMDPSSK